MRLERRDLTFAVVVALCLVAILIIPVAPEDDWRQFKADFLAALIAIAVAVPLGLWIDRVAEARTHAREEAARNVRRRLVLEGLTKEARFNRSLIEEIETHTEDPPKLLPLYDCRTQFWEAMSASGGLAVIEDAALLGDLAEAYYVIRGLDTWRRLLRDSYASLDALTAIQVTDPDGAQRDSTRGRELRRISWRVLREAAKSAAPTVDKALATLNSSVAGN